MDFSVLEKDGKLILHLTADVTELLPAHLGPDDIIGVRVMPEPIDDPVVFGQVVVELREIDRSGQ